MTGAELIVALLERQGVDTVAGIPGGANLPLYDALRGSGLRHVLARHEQGAGFVAQGMARATGRVGVCLGTSGPGATNLLTAIADAKLDSVPLVAVTGQVGTSMMGTDAFQEVDTYGLTLPITKHNFIVRRAEELLEVVPEAFRIALSGRPGPVVVDVPKDVQTGTAQFDAWPAPGVADGVAAPEGAGLDRLVEMIASAARPVFYVGGGVVASGAAAQLTALARRNGIPVTCTLNGLGVFPPDDPLYLGMLGMHGARGTNLALEEADLLLAFGVRFDDRATGRARDFCRGARIAHVDIDASEIDKIKATNLALVADVGAVLDGLLDRVPARNRSAWRARVAALMAEGGLRMPTGGDVLEPLALVREVAALAGPEAIITTDVGQHQMWVAQAYPFRHPRKLQTSGGLGTMGFGLPAAIGAALACPEVPVVCVSGDGSFLMNIQELATLAELGLNVKVVLMNNAQLGLVRQQQSLFYGGRHHAAHFENRVDFAAVSAGFGVPGVDLGRTADPAAALAEAMAAPGPCVINAPITAEANVFPMVPPGAANYETIEGELSHA